MRKTKPQPSPAGNSADVYQLRIELADLPVWRTLRVPGDINLGLLHAVIQVAMGWTNSHLHQFEVGDDTYSDLSHEEATDFVEPEVLDENKTLLKDVMPREEDEIIYEYDFGDSWTHYICVEKILGPEAIGKHFAECIDGGYACPPDDCGGVGGYLDLLEIIKDPGHEEYESMMEWLGGQFDPDAFNIKKVNTCLRKLTWPDTTEDGLAKVLMARDGIRE